jgi:hypothetical protein
MTLLRQKVEDELDALDNRTMAAVYEHLRLLNTMRKPRKRHQSSSDIEDVLRLTASSKGSWGETVVAGREERQ